MLSPSKADAIQGENSPRRRFDVALEDGARVKVRVFGHGPRLIMSHGNGLAIDAYRPFWDRLLDRHEVVMFDFRHHGLSSKYQKPMRNWPQFVRDFETILSAIDRELGSSHSIGVFHSMSALTALLHAAENPSPWRALLAFEPPVPPRPEHAEHQPYFDMHRDLAEGAARRRESFESIDRMAENFRGRASFRRIEPDALYGLAAATLRHDAQTGKFHLACAREFESETFRLQHLGDAWGRVSSVTLPVCIVAGDPNPDENRCLATVARRIAADGNFKFQSVPDSTHFLQIERPSACVAAFEKFVMSL